MQQPWIPTHRNRIEDDAMDIDDERILGDVTTLRASSWQAASDSIFEGVPRPENVRTHTCRLRLQFDSLKGINYFVVLDSNVLISYLPLVQQLHATIIRQNLQMSLCLPNVVVSELNFLKERNPNPNTRALAQAANVWLLAQIRNRTGPLRGQQKDDRLTEEDRPRVRTSWIGSCSVTHGLLRESMMIKLWIIAHIFCPRSAVPMVWYLF
jgi:hypothetical protein